MIESKIWKLENENYYFRNIQTIKDKNWKKYIDYIIWNNKNIIKNFYNYTININNTVEKPTEIIFKLDSNPLINFYWTWDNKWFEKDKEWLTNWDSSKELNFYMPLSYLWKNKRWKDGNNNIYLVWKEDKW